MTGLGHFTFKEDNEEPPMSINGIVDRLSTLQKNMPKYAKRAQDQDVYQGLETTFLTLLEELGKKYGRNNPAFNEYKHWYLEHKGIENL